MKKKILCLYDGFKIRIFDQKCIKLILEQREKFDLKPTFDYSGKRVLRVHGKYLNLDINIHGSGLKKTLIVSGSIHTFYNRWWTGFKQNHDDFYWDEFLEAFNEIVRVLNFNPKQANLENLEIGVNCLLPSQINLTVREIIESIICLFNAYKNKNIIIERNRNSYTAGRGEMYFKFYGKGIQFKIDHRLVRIEMGYERVRQIKRDAGCKVFYDLTDPDKHARFKKVLIKKFQTLHIHHPELVNVPVSEIEADREILEYSSPLFWSKVKPDRNHFTKARKKHDWLTNQYCKFNLKVVLIQMLSEKLQ